MNDRILIAERDVADRAVWRYGLADEHGQLSGDACLLRQESDEPPHPIGREDRPLWPTVILLLGQAGDRDRLVYDLTLRPIGYQPPPARPPDQWRRATDAKAKTPGETLAQRAERARQGRPRAAA